MRKWMRERLQRSKKNTEPDKQPAPPPLQPAYFEGASPEAGAGEAEAAVHQASPVEDEAPTPYAEPAPRRSSGREANVAAEPVEARDNDEEAAPSEPQTQRAAGPAQRGRTRRRRGGRGRGGRGREQAVAQAFTPAAVKGSIPEGSVDAEPLGSPETGAEQQPAPEAPKSAAAAQRPPKGIVVLAIGLPGSGKSSWFKRHNIVPLSSDTIRALLFDDVREQRFQDLVFSNLRSMLKARLIAKRPMNYVDATNLTPQERQHWIKLAKDYGYEVQAVFFDVPLEVCIDRHQRRDRVVPEDVMRRMAAKLKAPAFPEGFAKITVVRVKKKEGAEQPAAAEEATEE